VQFIIKKSFIIFIFIILLLPQNKSYSISLAKNIDDFGIITLMYHRFNENKYPSTNIKMDDFKKQLEIIEKENIHFVNPKEFENDLISNKIKRKILLTIDDAFLSFYENAWPILKEKRIPFILFVNTREVGSFNYMTWQQIKELYAEDFVEIGNHSHSHEYLVDESFSVIKKDIVKSIKIFKNRLGKNSYFFSYPFGEYSLEFKKIIKELGFKYAFGQHSGVIDETKDFFELPRFPINEKYGDLKRFKILTKTLPLKYKNIFPAEKYLSLSKNPPNIKVEFFENMKNIKKINCYSNEENVWKKSEINFINNQIIEIKLKGKFIGERGRINCSLRENGGFWRWLGIQFVIAKK
jgi:peptidoglycan/xylan/chitin deacetylase (PgdA/CDA1 family)